MINGTLRRWGSTSYLWHLPEYEGRVSPRVEVSQGIDATKTYLRKATKHKNTKNINKYLQVWYDLPSDVFHTAVSNIDTFLAKMKVKIHHIFKIWLK